VGTIHVIGDNDKIDTDVDAKVRAVSLVVPVEQASTTPVNSVDEEEFARQMKKIESSLPAELTNEERELLTDALSRYKDVLCATKLGSTSVMTFDIDPGEAAPVCHKIQRWAPQEVTAIKAQVDSLLAAGLIEPSDSGWSSRLVCAPKKNADGEKVDVRVCVDFRDVNALCVKDAYPAPNVDATLDQLSGSMWFSSIDLAKGYHQVPLTERAKQICSFRGPSGFFRYTHMPFGVMNAPAVFQRMMDLVLRGLTWISCMVYMDDVVVYSKTWAEHVKHICEILQRLREANLTVGIKKCQEGDHVSWLCCVTRRSKAGPEEDRGGQSLYYTRDATAATILPRTDRTVPQVHPRLRRHGEASPCSGQKGSNPRMAERQGLDRRTAAGI
jgi:hypothetical protein